MAHKKEGREPSQHVSSHQHSPCVTTLWACGLGLGPMAWGDPCTSQCGQAFTAFFVKPTGSHWLHWPLTVKAASKGASGWTRGEVSTEAWGTLGRWGLGKQVWLDSRASQSGGHTAGALT